jgi:hypothetical protein
MINVNFGIVSEVWEKPLLVGRLACGSGDMETAGDGT